MLHIRGHWRVETVMLFRDGMDETQMPRMEGLAFEFRNGNADGFFGRVIG